MITLRARTGQSRAHPTLDDMYTKTRVSKLRNRPPAVPWADWEQRGLLHPSAITQGSRWAFLRRASQRTGSTAGDGLELRATTTQQPGTRRPSQTRPPHSHFSDTSSALPCLTSIHHHQWHSLDRTQSTSSTDLDVSLHVRESQHQPKPSDNPSFSPTP